ncbi:alpha/beta hydrolase-fold protein [Tsukamurella serpentis]
MSSDPHDRTAVAALRAAGITAVPGTPEFWNALVEHGTPVFIRTDGGFDALVLRATAGVLRRECERGPVPLRRLSGAPADPAVPDAPAVLGDPTVPGAAVWFTTFHLPSGHRQTYWFEDEPSAAPASDSADPHNQESAGPGRSLAVAPDAAPQPYWPPRTPDRIEPLPRPRIRWRSDILGNRRTVRVHRTGTGGPVAILLDGDDWLFRHPIAPALDAAHADGRIPDATFVIVPATDREAEFTGGALWRAIIGELLDLVAESGPADRSTVVAAGQSLGGLSVLRAALDHPGLLRAAAVQSGAFWWPAPPSGDPLAGPAGGEIAERLEAGADLGGLRLFLDTGAAEPRMHRHIEAVADLAGRCGADVHTQVSPAGHDCAGWRHALVRDLCAALTALR